MQIGKAKENELETLGWPQVLILLGVVEVNILMNKLTRTVLSLLRNLCSTRMLPRFFGGSSPWNRCCHLKMLCDS